MEALKEFEYPLPVLSINTDKIVIEANEDYTGFFTVKNTGGGLLAGRVTSSTHLIKFTPEKFEANETKIFYKLDFANLKTGDVVHTNAVISSNGGEKKLSVVVRKLPPSLQVSQDVRITNLRDFLTFAKKETASAVEIFYSPKFRKWLSDVDYAYIEVLDYLLDDINRERALDNFFILSKLKKKNSLVFSENKSVIELRRNESKSYYGSLKLKKTGWGFFESSVYLEKGAPWIRIGTDRVSADDFTGNSIELVPINFEIEPLLIKSSYVSERVCIAGDSAEIIVKKLPYMRVKLSKQAYGIQDSGFITVENFTGRDQMVEVSVQDSFIKFEAKKYVVGENEKIPFNTKLTIIQSSQMILRNQPGFSTKITVAANVDGRMIRYELPVTVGEM